MRSHGLLLILVATLTLSGCLVPPPISARGGEGARAASATEQAEGAGASPSVPPEAREQTREGAVAFTRHWWEVLKDVRASGDAQPLMDITDVQCGVCAAVRNSALGAHYDGSVEEPWPHLRVTKAEPLDEAGTAVVHAQQQEGPSKLYIDGELVEEIEGGILRFAFHLRFQGGGWVLEEIVPG